MTRAGKFAAFLSANLAASWTGSVTLSVVIAAMVLLAVYVVTQSRKEFS